MVAAKKLAVPLFLFDFGLALLEVFELALTRDNSAAAIVGHRRHNRLLHKILQPEPGAGAFLAQPAPFVTKILTASARELEILF